ncbi:fimbrial protein [Escherichia coli]|uniref:fimbrial protein n=1 Tax=Escherichia coli TaxID=562 RepID=UPI0017FF4757|nr:fimbrial protein [Escherichia coli]MEC4929686.1 fimbrial protein [Escherichia coli]MEC4934980.1 fimbrial protein [Escherichia coli]MEC4945543.1 fimbrial protein [Escherichia coli]MEC4955893.1 fimbrial protein [Escherichia coli]
MSLRVWAVAGGMMLMWGIRGYAADSGAGASASDYREQSTDITFTASVKEPACQIEAPASVDFGEPRVITVRERGVERDFNIILKKCTQRIPKPKLIFAGNLISDDGMYLKNKNGTEEYATGVGIRLYYRGNNVSLKEGLALSSPLSPDVTTTLPFRARLGKEGSGEVTAGKVEASVTLSMTYY